MYVHEWSNSDLSHLYCEKQMYYYEKQPTCGLNEVHMLHYIFLTTSL